MDQMTFGDAAMDKKAPMADRLRPQQLHDVIGQTTLLEEKGLLRQSIEAGQPYSMILYGPPGTGKTTIALCVARAFGLQFEQLNAVTDGVKELREIISRAVGRRGLGDQTVLFIDEIGRWNKAQQDALLPYVEDGTVILIGATTEHPGFQLNQALRSRLRIETLQKPSTEEAHIALQRALQRSDGLDGVYTIDQDAAEALIVYADGDIRRLYNCLEAAAGVSRATGEITLQSLISVMGKTSYSRESYDLMSALQKSVRGSDPDAAMYWLARMEATGEDPSIPARRLLVCAHEDVNSPAACMLAASVFQSVQFLGAPEAWIPLASLTCYLATATKNWDAYTALNNARAIVETQPAYPVPLHLQSAPVEDVPRPYVHPKSGKADQAYLPDGVRERPYTQAKQ